MWASAPTNIHEKSTDFEGGQSRPPLQRVLKTRRVRRKLLRLPFCVVGVDAHIDPQEMAGLLRFSGEIVLFFYSTP